MKVAVVVITSALLWDGVKAQNAIQGHAVNLIEIRLGERWKVVETSAGKDSRINESWCEAIWFSARQRYNSRIVCCEKNARII